MSVKVYMPYICCIFLLCAVTAGSLHASGFREIPKRELSVASDSYMEGRPPNRAILEVPFQHRIEWRTTNAVPNWFRLDLGARRNIARLELFWDTAASLAIAGVIRNYNIYVTNDPDTWGSAVASGEWSDARGWKTNDFPSMPRGRYLVVEALSRHSTDTCLFDLKVFEAPFVFTDKQTGSRRFTNSNSVDITSFWVPSGYDRYQITEAGASPSGVWINTNAPPSGFEFIQPVGDAEVHLTAWFTNSTQSVALTNITADIFFTSTPPVPSVKTDLNIEIAPGTSVRVLDALDLNSSGGVAGGETQDVWRLSANILSGPIYAEDCMIVDNKARYGSGGLQGTYNRCVFKGNYNDQGVGGAACGGWGAAAAYLTNCLVINNSGRANQGAGVNRVYAVNCTIANNTYGTRDCGSGVFGLLNCIVFGSSVRNLRGDTIISYSCFINDDNVTITGSHNIETDPMFVDPGSGNYKLQWSGTPENRSPCIDAGFNEAWMLNDQDIAGNPRILPFGGVVDMGCYEFKPPPAGMFFFSY